MDKSYFLWHYFIYCGIFYIINDLSMQIFFWFYLHALLLFSLMTCELDWGQDNNRSPLTTCHSHDITTVANDNNPINSRSPKSSPALYFVSFEKPFHSGTRHNREEKPTLNKCIHIESSVCNLSVKTNFPATLSQIQGLSWIMYTCSGVYKCCTS